MRKVSLVGRTLGKLGLGRKRAKPRRIGYRKPALEPLERRELLSITPLPQLVADENPVAAGDSATIRAYLPTDASSSTVHFTNGASWEDATLSLASAGGALALDGTGYASVPGKLKFTGGDFTMSVWFDPSNADLSTYLVFRGRGYNDQQGDIGFKINGTTGKLDFQARTSDGQWLFGWDAPESSLSASFNVGQWNHVVVTRSGSNYGMWMNDVNVANTTSSKEISDDADSNPLHIGAITDDSGVPSGLFQGLVGEFDVFNRAVNSSEIATLYNGGAGYYGGTGWGPTASGLVAGYHFDAAPNGRVTDYSNHNLNATLFGGASIASGPIAKPKVAVYTTSFADVGSYQVTAAYSDVNGTSTASLTETVLKASVTTLASPPTSSYQGESVTVTAEVRAADNSALPGGIVQFFADGTYLARGAG